MDRNQAHDELLRCTECKRLVRHRDIISRGMCSCGNRRFREVATLSVWEWLRIRLGLLRFPGHKTYLREFSRGR